MAYRSLDQIDLAQIHAEISEELNQKAVRLLDLTSKLAEDPGQTSLRQEVIRLNQELGNFEEAKKYQ